MSRILNVTKTELRFINKLHIQYTLYTLAVDFFFLIILNRLDTVPRHGYTALRVE